MASLRVRSQRDKAQRDKLPDYKGPGLVLSIVKVARDQTQPGSLLARPGW